MSMLDLFTIFFPLFFTAWEFHQRAQPIRLDKLSWYG